MEWLIQGISRGTASLSAVISVGLSNIAASRLIVKEVEETTPGGSKCVIVNDPELLALRAVLLPPPPARDRSHSPVSLCPSLTHLTCGAAVLGGNAVKFNTDLAHWGD